jgi:hypothetical protein
MRYLHEMNAFWTQHVCLSVCPSICERDSTREPLDGFGLNLVWPLCHRDLSGSILKSSAIPNGGRTNLWGGMDTRATYNSVIQWFTVIDFLRIRNFGTVILCVISKTTSRLHEKNNFDLTRIRSHDAATKLTLIALYCYWFAVLKEDIRNTWYV